MKTKKIFYLIAALIVATVCTYGQEKAGTTSMQFLKIMPCARATALGDAYSAVAKGVEAVFWNPAGLAWTDNQEISLTYIQWIFDARLYDLAYALPLGKIGNIGVQFQYVDYGDFDEAVVTGVSTYPGQTQVWLTGNTFKPYDLVVGLSYARKMTSKFSFGVTAKYAYESLFNESQATSYALLTTTKTYQTDTKRGIFLFDAGFHYNTGFRTVCIAASAQNFGQDVKYKSTAQETAYPAPLMFRIGTAADLLGPNSLFGNQQNSRLGMMFDLFLVNDATQQEHLGLEYEFAQTVALRIGYKFNYGTENLTFGGGVKQTIGKLKISIDYSFGRFDGIISDFTGNSHRISVGVGIQ